MVVASSKDTLATLQRGVTHVVLNTHEVPTGDFVLDTQFSLPAIRLRRGIADAVGADAADMLDATQLATALLGDSIATNPFLLGYAWQRGRVPLTLDSLLQAIALNGTAVEANTAAFTWGRLAAADPARVAQAAGIAPARTEPKTLDERIATRAEHLTAYQSRRYAKRYLDMVEQVREIEGRHFSGATGLTEAVARGLHKLMAYKDEYEVARLYAAPEFRAQLEAQFETPSKIEFHLAPPLLARRDKRTGHQIKRSYGPWMMSVFRILAKFRFLRGTALDLFGRSDERRAERALVAQYEADIAAILPRLNARTLPVAVALAELPGKIRGFGHVKEKSIREAALDRTRLLEKMQQNSPAMPMAAE
jgi:indolepyruvate ferredoxin oxidoreductase